MLRVLMIGDPGVCTVLSKTLSALGYGIDVTSDSCRGLALAGERTYTHVLIDHDIDERDGIRLFEQLRSLQRGAVGVLLTAADNLTTVVAAFDAGMRRVLHKPVDCRQLIALLRQFPSRTEVMAAALSFNELDIARLSQHDIRERLSVAELIDIIRSVEYPFAGKERLEHFDRDTLERVVHLICRWCRQRAA